VERLKNDECAISKWMNDRPTLQAIMSTKAAVMFGINGALAWH